MLSLRTLKMHWHGFKRNVMRRH
uniref:Uncharacterized protein n=1 Tax=Ciona intestinalis TaxID=7719 RepID=H2XN65_CIOIN